METALTALQQAYLLGRSDRWPLGGVAMHDFREYRARQPDMPRFEARLTELVQHYPALRTCIDVQRGTQHVRPEVTLHLAQDLAAHSSPAALAALICQRSPEAGRHAKTLLAALAPQH